MGPSRTSHWAAEVGKAAQAACQLLLQTVLTACGACALFWLFLAGTWRWRNDAFWRHFPPSFGCDDSRLLDGCQVVNLMWFVVLPAVACLAAVGFVALSSCREGDSTTVKRAQPISILGRLHSLQLPPQKFWSWWCGGFTGTDAVVVAIWLAINVTWVFAVMGRYQKLLPMFQELTHTPTWQLEWELIATTFGALLFPNYLALFYPVSRGSALLQATGLSWPEGIRYHRWVGHVTMVFVTAHSLGFWVIWLIQGVWWHEALSNGPRLSNLFGGISFIGGLALWITSLDASKRLNYGIFYSMHHIGFWVFMLGGIMHYQLQLVYFLPCLLLYAVDAAYRVHQALFDKSATVLHTSVAQEDGQATICSVVIKAPQFGVAKSGYIWLHVRAAHMVQWHPYEYVAVSAGDGIPALQVFIKSYDRWSQRVVALVAQQGTAMRVKVEGPYAELPPVMQHHQQDAVVIVAGGVGITAALSVLEEISHGAGSKHGAAPPVLLVWSCRHASDLQLLAPPVLGLAGELGLDVSAHIHFTGMSSALTHEVTVFTSDGQQTLPGEAAGPAGTTPLCPVVAFGNVAAQVLHKVAIHAAVFVAAVGAMLLARGLTTVWPPGGMQWRTSAGGLVTVVLAASAMLLAGLVVLWLSLAGGWLTRKPDGLNVGVKEPLLAAQSATASTASNTKRLAGNLATPAGRLVVAAGGTSTDGAASHALVLGLHGDEQRLPVQCGRPDVKSIVLGWLAQRRQHWWQPHSCYVLTSTRHWVPASTAVVVCMHSSVEKRTSCSLAVQGSLSTGRGGEASQVLRCTCRSYAAPMWSQLDTVRLTDSLLLSHHEMVVVADNSSRVLQQNSYYRMYHHQQQCVVFLSQIWDW